MLENSPKRTRIDTGEDTYTNDTIHHCTIKETWSTSLSSGTRISSMATANTEISLGTEGGSILLVNQESPNAHQEIERSGPPVLSLLMKKLLPEIAGAKTTTCDIVAGDAQGRITVYNVGRMFSRNVMSGGPVSTIVAGSDFYGPKSFVIGNMNGVVASCHAQDVLWRVRVDHQGVGDLAVTAVGSVVCPDSGGVPTNYVIVATGAGGVDVVARGNVVTRFPSLGICNTICPGNFTRIPVNGDQLQQALLGDEKGNLFVFDNFKIESYAKIDYGVVQVISIPSPLPSKEMTDIVVCLSQSNKIFVFHNKKVIGKHSLDFWPISIGLGSRSDESLLCVIIAGNKVDKHGKDTGVVMSLSLDMSISE